MSEHWTTTPALGATFARCLSQEVTRVQIAQYAGASGDFNPLHLDDDYARERSGRTGVIAHGMLTMGLTGTFVTDLVDHRRLRSFGGRFVAPVEPGDRLECVVTVDRIVEQLVDLAVETRSQRGVVFVGQATAAFD